MGASEEQEVRDKIAALCLSKYGNKSPASMQKLFESYDESGDKCLNSAELYELFSDADISYGFPIYTRKLYVSGVIDALDKDPVNGCVSWTEYLAATSKSAPPAADPTKTTDPAKASPPPPKTDYGPPPPPSDPSCDPKTGICLQPPPPGSSSPMANALGAGAMAFVFGASLPVTLGLAGLAFALSPKSP